MHRKQVYVVAEPKLRSVSVDCFRPHSPRLNVSCEGRV